MTVYWERDEGKRIDEISLNDAVMATGLHGYGDMNTRKERLLNGEMLIAESGSYFVREEDE
ncbi:hypothetical protein KAR91_52485 [Candidatus Pacearchaeota archaeon]|nr:hypothetical protein [Candidatus Pacearchaeota archaeon]